MIFTFAVAKGLLIALATQAMDIAFWKSIVIAAISGVIGAGGAIVAAYIAARGARENRTLLQDVKQRVGADRREGETRDE